MRARGPSTDSQDSVDPVPSSAPVLPGAETSAEHPPDVETSASPTVPAVDPDVYITSGKFVVVFVLFL